MFVNILYDVYILFMMFLFEGFVDAGDCVLRFGFVRFVWGGFICYFLGIVCCVDVYIVFCLGRKYFYKLYRFCCYVIWELLGR